VKIKLIKLLLVVILSVWVSSCTTFSKRDINVTRLPDPVALIYGEPAPFDGILTDEEYYKMLLKEAYRCNE